MKKLVYLMVICISLFLLSSCGANPWGIESWYSVSNVGISNSEYDCILNWNKEGKIFSDDIILQFHEDKTVNAFIFGESKSGFFFHIQTNSMTNYIVIFDDGTKGTGQLFTYLFTGYVGTIIIDDVEYSLSSRNEMTHIYWQNEYDYEVVRLKEIEPNNFNLYSYNTAYLTGEIILIEGVYTFIPDNYESPQNFATLSSLDMSQGLYYYQLNEDFDFTGCEIKTGRAIMKNVFEYSSDEYVASATSFCIYYY